jgi:benzaldehyde dehydrogenase (NAD)
MAFVAQRPSDGRLYVDGTYRGSDEGLAVVREKATGRELGRQVIATVTDLDVAIAGARHAQPAWAATPYDTRAGLLRKVAGLLERRAAEYADLIVRETGSIAGKAHYEVAAASNELYGAAALTTRATGEILPSSHTGKLSIIQRIPVGVVGVITPWNFPLILAMRAVAPAIALGNSVILKPATFTPISGGQLIAELFDEAGAPPGVLQVVTGPGEELGEAMAAHPGVDMIHFTGSSEVGRTLAAIAGRHLKRVSLELGGNNALVVLDDADIETASMIGAWSTFHYQGQTCITASRHIVMRGVAEAYREALARRARAIVVGDPTKQGVGLGPIIDERQRDRVHDIVERSVREGARVIEGATYDGLFYRPTVLDGVTPTMPAFTEEIFGPVAPITVVDTVEEALALTNATESGLVNAVVTNDVARGLAFAERVHSGMVHVNDATPLDEAHVPFGGLGASGLGGRVGGEANLEEFTERRWISVQRTPVQYPY